MLIYQWLNTQIHMFFPIKSNHRHCGIENPSWAEIRHFVNFLDSQLQACEESSFCNMELVGDTLEGFRSFVVRFMILMSRVRYIFITRVTQFLKVIPSNGQCTVFLVHLSLHPVLLARYFVFPLSRLLFIQELTTILIFPFVILRFLSYPCIIHPFFKAFVCLPVIQKDRDMPSFSLSRKCLKPISKRPSLSWHQFAEEPAENILLVLLKRILPHHL